MIMLQLHSCHVCSEVDYGSFVCDSTTKSKVSTIDPVHNMRICLATGTFWTNCLESVYVESGELPLFLWRNLLLCCYTVRLAALPHHPLHGAVFQPTFCSRYELNTAVSRPVGVHFCQLLQWLNIFLPYIIPHRHSQIPPWQIICPSFILRLIRHGRSTSVLVYCQCFTKLLSAYLDHTVVFTDGSFVH
jgi:hypothetical protein